MAERRPIRSGPPSLPSLPQRVTDLVVLRRYSSRGKGFLSLTRLLVRNVYENGAISRPYRFEMVERRGVDSVALVPFFRRGGRLLVLMKAGFRPALFLRGRRVAPGEGVRSRCIAFEAVAGSLEPNEVTERRIRARAARELREEAGYALPPGHLISLGAGFFPSHGQCTEKIHLFAASLNGARRVRARGDGSVNEADAFSLMLEAGDILRRCRRGEIEDPKLEIGVVRLQAILQGERRSP